MDIIIADGGSTDGSLDPVFLAQTGVRARLTKTGPGKDGGDAIDRFVATRGDGFGYVQGARSAAGGTAVNTPLDRKIDGHPIHAPLLSLAGRRWYTDTTNGFRTYSAAYLSDPRVDPLRDRFQRYALLFCLTGRAGPLGYRTCEIPVSRTYPAGEKTPTKISGLKGRMAMMTELLDVVRGRYAPG